ncbi:MAG: EmrA/EmrK family multidrug efflux transporter periplasmic adaptor subunit [Neisseriaceae bacterium]|nr:EmrA/EmrK family multidrug efflux transporter periplasmic adaptor subunit [Neisseriaceae bacterium]MBP6862329.1 EmrA/EmrK family multidrug efflux transporter periplasmic adaptor subunit [Neisseriaceae bacterium]
MKKTAMGQKRKRNMVVATLLFIIIALVFLLLWLFIWQHEESTDDAYVNGNVVQITPQISGTVAQINVEDTDTVAAGATLVILDENDAKLAFERARNELINALRQNRQLTANTRQFDAQVLLSSTQLAKAQTDLQRRERLAGTDAISAEELSHAREAVLSAQAQLTAAQEQAKAAKALIGNSSIDQQPAVQTAASHLKTAWLELQRTHLRAPVEGQVARRNVQVGQRINPGAPLMAVVPLNDLWIDANFKESQLVNLRIGQPVNIKADLYGKKVTYSGKVMGLSAGTGSAFSVLPAQNATGNWIKIVQRVPVRISLDPKELAQNPLRVGLSMHVVVNTADQAGKNVTDTKVENLSVRKSSALTPDLAQADALIAEIIADNVQ